VIGILLGEACDDQTIESVYKNNKNYCLFGMGAVSQKYPVPYLQTLRVYDFGGTVISTDIPTAILVAKLKMPSKKYFYIRSLEWVGFQPLIYEELKSIYLNEEVELIVSNEKDYGLIKGLFKEPKFIVKDWNFSEIENE
tara:strand:+ start:12355 stop:12771 length:417 start_codon:yes stop_codon:yes gene_type:complete